MAYNPQSKRLTGLNPLAYLGVEPLSPPEMVIDNRVPTINDYDNFNLGTFWLDSINEILYILVNKADGIATWIPLSAGGGGGPITGLVGDNAVTAFPLAGLINLKGGTNITTVASGNNVTFNISGLSITDGTVYYNGTGLATTATGTTGQVLTSNGAGVAPTYQSPSFNALTFDADSGSATPSSDIINFVGAGTVTTSAAGNTVTITGSASGGLIKTTTFTTSDTWIPDPRTTLVIAYGWGGGSGGASGRQGLNTLAGGGAGGGSSTPFYIYFPISFFNPLGETVTIGAGASGAVGQVSANTNGNAGSIATNSYLGNISQVSHNATPPPGGLTGPTGTGSPDGFGLFIIWVAGGGSGGPGSNVDGGTPSGVTGGVPSTSVGGGGGAGADSGTERTGGNGGDITTPDGLTILVAGGAGGVESGTIDGGNGSNQLTTLTGGLMCGASGGGGGGGQSTGLVAGNGGNGGFPGGGGGGGGGSFNGTTSGAGGNGADGLVIVIELFL